MSENQQESNPRILSEKETLTKELYHLIISQNKISFKEGIWFEPKPINVFNNIYLNFNFKKTNFILVKRVRIRQSTSSIGIIGEEQYFVSSPYNLKASQVQIWMEEIKKHISNSQEKPEVLAKEGEKICATCKLPYPFSEFHFHHSNKDRLASDCKGCISIKSKEARRNKIKLTQKATIIPDGKIPAIQLTEEQKQESKKEYDRNNIMKFLNL